LQWTKGDFIISDEVALIDINTVSQLLVTTYWASTRTRETIENSIKNSISFGVYHNSNQIGFARVVSDKAVFSWVLDVVIEEKYRNKGIGKWLIECILAHPEIKNTKFALATLDAHDFYKQFNFKDNQCMTRALVSS
jgi:N-acetylglutamate synthase-like GNAT family acetyltransferase